MSMITFQEYKALQLELKRCKDDMNRARYSLQTVAEVLGKREELSYDDLNLLKEICLSKLRKEQSKDIHELGMQILAIMCFGMLLGMFAGFIFVIGFMFSQVF